MQNFLTFLVSQNTLVFRDLFATQPNTERANVRVGNLESRANEPVRT